MKFISTGKWSYCVDGNEYFIGEYDTKEEAIKELLSYEESGEVGENYTMLFDENDVPDLEEEIFLALSDSLRDEVGDLSEEWWIEHWNELNKEIAKAVINHINKYKLQPTGYYTVKKIEEIKYVKNQR